MMITFKDAYREIDQIYKRFGAKGVGAAADCGDEWAFHHGGGKMVGIPIIFVNKETGEQRDYNFLTATEEETKKLNSGKLLDIKEML